jgi:hypothetical protein
MYRFRLFLLSLPLPLLLSACEGPTSSPPTSPPATNSAIQTGGARQGAPLSRARAVSTPAALATDSVDGTGPAARFNQIYAITTDGTNLYVADYFDSTIRKVVPATGEVTTMAGIAGVWDSTDGMGTAARFSHPMGITSDGANLFVADTYNHTIRKIVIATGLVTTLTGSAGTPGSTDGKGARARFNYPQDITTDGTNLFVAENCAHAIRTVVIATGEVTTLAGTAGSGGSADGTGVAARFDSIGGLATDGTNLFVAENSDHTIRKVVIATGEVTTLAATAGSGGSADGTDVAARFGSLIGLATDGTNLFATDSQETIRKIVIASGDVTTIAGLAWNIGAEDGKGAAASFNDPYGITTNGTSLFITDIVNRTIRKVVIATGDVTTLAGARSPGSADGAGSAARFYGPQGITTDGTNLFAADANNNTIRKSN